MEIFIIAWKVDLGGAGPLMGKNLNLLPLRSWISITRNSWILIFLVCAIAQMMKSIVAQLVRDGTFVFSPSVPLQSPKLF